jgi:hypothetical protein
MAARRWARAVALLALAALVLALGRDEVNTIAPHVPAARSDRAVAGRVVRLLQRRGRGASTSSSAASGRGAERAEGTSGAREATSPAPSRHAALARFKGDFGAGGRSFSDVLKCFDTVRALKTDSPRSLQRAKFNAFLRLFTTHYVPDPSDAPASGNLAYKAFQWLSNALNGPAPPFMKYGLEDFGIVVRGRDVDSACCPVG